MSFFPGSTELWGAGVALCDCFWWFVVLLADCPGVRIAVRAVVGLTLDWPRLLVDWLDFDWIFGLLFFLPGFPDFALASVPRLLAPCMIPEIPAETPDVAVSSKLSLTLRTPETTEPAAPNSPVKNPPELSLVGVLGELGTSLGPPDSWGVSVLFVRNELSRSRSSRLRPEPSLVGGSSGAGEGVGLVELVNLTVVVVVEFD